MVPIPGILSFLSLNKGVRLFKTPFWVKWFYPGRIWHLSRKEKLIYLTFDDGPTPDVTRWILDMLDTYDAKATFFCVGENMQRYPDLVKEAEQCGHTIGNHTYHHKKGTVTSLVEYMSDVEKFHQIHSARIFRPPYGRLPSTHAKAVRKEGYKIVMWDVLTYDFDEQAETEYLWKKIVRNIEPGSIIVFHDNIKAEKHLHILLPRTLAYYANQGYTFAPLCL
jgi:peptidoglycan/xylan/chitin deacetylase (PgdA/CDA1 family)